jgi:pyruvate,water dikinase
MANEARIKSVTPDFQVTWTDPADGERTWIYDDIHYNTAMPLLTQDIFYAMQVRLGRPPVFLNGYAFALSTGPTQPGPEMAGRNPFQIWRDEFQPRILEGTRRWREADYASMSMPDLAAYIAQVFEEATELHYLTMTTLQGFLAPGVALIEFCLAELGEEGAVMATTLLQGEANQSTGADTVLGELATFASSHVALADALKAGRYDGLSDLEGGAEFTKRFDAFIDAFGWRADSWSTPHLQTWAEQPEAALRLVTRYLNDPAHAPAAGLEGARKRRDEALAELEGKLAADKLPRFRELLSNAAQHVPYSEQRQFAQLLIFGSMRAPILAFGRKLVSEGVLSEANDVFHLSLVELPVLATGWGIGQQQIVKVRKENLARWSKLTPPLSVGRDPSNRAMSPAQLQFMRLFRGPATRLDLPQPGDLIKGMAASRGLVTGTARVIRDLSQSDRLQPGDILVCETTSAPWTPLFAIAGAVVTDSGGILSHSAICAREYGIPCVVGTSVATRSIPDGATVTVDGTAGTVQAA